MIKAIDIYKSYGNLQVLKGINLEIQKGEIVSIVGASGAGKSTLLHILGTLDKADQGIVEINGIAVNQLSEKNYLNSEIKKSGLFFNSIICYLNLQL